MNVLHQSIALLYVNDCVALEKKKKKTYIITKKKKEIKKNRKNKSLNSTHTKNIGIPFSTKKKKKKIKKIK